MVNSKVPTMSSALRRTTTVEPMNVAASGNGKKDHAPPVAGQPRCLGPGDRRCLDPVNGPICPMEKSLEPTADQRGKKVIHE